MILLVRHGETSGNANRVIQTPDTPLNEQGLSQARRLARRLVAYPVGLIVSSDLARARTTAECVREATGARLLLDPGLQERNFGDLRGTPYATLDVDPFAADFIPPAGESWAELHARADAVWARIAGRCAETPGDLVVVTHGLVCHSWISRRLTLAPDLPTPRGFANTSLTEVEAAPPWRVRLLNCTAHLEDDVPPRSGLRV